MNNKVKEERSIKCFNCNKPSPQSCVKKLICSHILCANCIGLLLFNNSFNNNHVEYKDIRYTCYCSKGDNTINQLEIITMLEQLASYNTTNRNKANISNARKCHQHNEPIDSYCKDCLSLLCAICIKSHNTHRLLSVSDYNEKNNQMISQLTHKTLEEQKASLMSLQLLFESTYERESNRIMESIDYIINSLSRIQQRIKDEYNFYRNYFTILQSMYNLYYFCLSNIELFSIAKNIQLDFSGVIINVNSSIDFIKTMAQVFQEKTDIILNDSILKYKFIVKPFILKYSSHKNYNIRKKLKFGAREGIGIPKKIIQLQTYSIAVGFSTETINIYDHLKYDLIKSMKGKENNSITSLIEINNGRLLSGSMDNTIKLWDINHSNYVEAFDAHLSSTTSLIQLRNGLVASGSNDGELKLWDLNTMKQIQILKPHQYRISAFIQLSYDDSRLVSGSFDCYIKVFRINDKDNTIKEEYSLYKLLSKINSIVELRDKRLCSVDSGVNVTVWDMDRRVVLFTFKAHTMEIVCVINLKNNRIATGSVDTLIKIWEIKEKITLMQTIEMNTSPINSIIQLRDKRIVSASTDLMIWG